MYLDMTEFAVAAEAIRDCEEMATLSNDEQLMILPKALKVLLNVVMERPEEAAQGMTALLSRRKSLPYPPPSIADGFVDLVDGIMKYRQGEDLYGEVSFGQGILGLSGMRMGSFFQGLGREWHGSILLEKGFEEQGTGAVPAGLRHVPPAGQQDAFRPGRLAHVRAGPRVEPGTDGHLIKRCCGTPSPCGPR